MQFHSDKDKLKKLKGKFDSVVLDVPCSGFGTFRRHPEAKLEYDEAFFRKLEILQKDLLREGSSYLKSGGRLYYMTCSVLDSENLDQIVSFLNFERGKFELVSHETIWPERHGNDGFFISVMEKN